MNNKAFNFGPPKTGETLLANLIKEILPNHTVHTSHHWEKYREERVVVTYRDPRDVLCSLIRNGDIDLSYWGDGFRVKLRQSFIDLLRVWEGGSDGVLFLCYEKFYNNFDYIFDRLENFYSITIDKIKREEMKNKYDIKKSTKIYEHLQTFDYLKNTTHGKHISPSFGSPGQWKICIPVEYHSEIETLLYPYITSMGYKTNIKHNKPEWNEGWNEGCFDSKFLKTPKLQWKIRK